MSNAQGPAPIKWSADLSRGVGNATPRRPDGLEPGVRLGQSGTPAHVREHLARLVPKLATFHDSPPLDDFGKVFNRKLRAPYWEDAGRSIGTSPVQCGCSPRNRAGPRTDVWRCPAITWVRGWASSSC